MQMTLNFTWLPLLCCRPPYIISTCFFNPKNNPEKVHDLVLRARLQTSDNVDVHSLGEESIERVMIWLSFKVHTLIQVQKLKLKLGFYYRNKACLDLSVWKALVQATFRKGDGLWRHNQCIWVWYQTLYPSCSIVSSTALLVFIRPKATVTLVYIYRSVLFKTYIQMSPSKWCLSSQLVACLPSLQIPATLEPIAFLPSSITWQHH